MSVVQRPLRPALRLTIPTHRRRTESSNISINAAAAATTVSSLSPTVSVGRLSLQVVKQIWSSYPEFNISSRTWESRRRGRRSSDQPTPVVSSINALGLDLGLPASGSQGAYASNDSNPLSTMDRESSIESGELLESARPTPPILLSSLSSPPSPLLQGSSIIPPPLQSPATISSPRPQPLPPATLAKARSILFESFNSFISSPPHDTYVSKLGTTLSDQQLRDIMHKGPAVLEDLRKQGHGEHLENLKRKYAIMAGAEGAAENQARWKRRRAEDDGERDAVLPPPPPPPPPPSSANSNRDDVEMPPAQNNDQSSAGTAPPTESQTRPGAKPDLDPGIDPYASRICVAKIGQNAAGLAEVTFDLDERVAEAAALWSRRAFHFQATEPHVRLHFVGVNRQDAESLVRMGDAQALPLLVSQLPPAWPPEGRLYVSLNYTKGLWDPSYFTSISPSLDISSAVHPGLNTLQIIALDDLSSTVFMVVMLPVQEHERRPWIQLEKIRQLTSNAETDSPRIVDFIPS